MEMDGKYRNAYMTGYADGVRDALEGRIKSFRKQEIGEYPVKTMGISQRAINSLSAAGCASVSDAAGLSEYEIATMRNVGKITAREIACWMIENNIMDSAWNKYL